LIDVLLSFVALLISIPILLIVGVLIVIESGFPPFFSHGRLGLSGKSIRIWKFRSMWKDAEDRLHNDPDMYEEYLQNDYKLPLRKDPRITPLGRVLRKTSVDEIPQFWNVLKGDMSLVGPRPIVEREIEKYSGYEDLLLSVKPGMTGLWQVSGRSRVRYPERADLDLQYVRDLSLKNDLKILARTVWVVIEARGAR